MWEDPIVAEIHRTREKLAADYNYDVKAFFADLRKRQGSMGGRLIRQKKRVEPPAQANQTHQSGTDESSCSEAAPAA